MLVKLFYLQSTRLHPFSLEIYLFDFMLFI